MRDNLKRVWVGTAVAILLYAGWALWGDVGTWQGHAPLQWNYIGLALGAALGNYLLRAWRWQWLLAKGGDVLGWQVALPTFLTGFFYTFTPGKIGEIAKSAHLYEMTGIPSRKSLPVIWMERSSDLAGVIVIAMPIFFWWGAGRTAFSPPDPFPSGPESWLAGLLVLFVLMLLPRLVIPIAKRLLPENGLSGADVFGERIAPLLRFTPLLLVWGWAAWLLEGFSCWYALAALGQSMDSLPAIQAYGGSMLVGAASMLPGGLGAAEWSLSTLLQSLGKLQEPLLANQATLLTRLVTLWFGFPLGVWAVWWATKKRGLHDSG